MPTASERKPSDLFAIAAMPAAMPDGREFCPCFESRRLARRIAGFYEAHVAPHIPLPPDAAAAAAGFGLTMQQFSLLGFVLARPGGAAQDYARLLDVERSTVTRNLALLERRGLVQQPADAADRRRRRPQATPAGRVAWRAGLAAWRAAQDAFKREIGGEAAFAGLIDLLRDVAALLPPANPMAE